MNWFVGKRFANNENGKSAVDDWFEQLDGSHYKQSIEAFERR